MFFLAVAIKCGTPNISNYFSAKNRSTPSTGHTKSGLQVSLCMKKEPTYKNWSYDITYLAGGCMMSYIFYYATLQPILATLSGNSLRINQPWIEALTSRRKAKTRRACGQEGG